MGLPKEPKHTFFLWGPRQTGKSSLLSRPEVLRERLLGHFKGSRARRFVIIDEFQRVPGGADKLSCWRLTTGVEVDFIVGKMTCAIEAKSSQKITGDHLKGLREIIKEYPHAKNRIVVSLESHSRLTDDGIHILSYGDFSRPLWNGELF